MRVFKVRSAVFQLVFYPFVPLIDAGPVYRDLCIILPKCKICGREFDVHAISGELTCFVHGNPNGSQFEREIFWKKQGEILGSIAGEC